MDEDKKEGAGTVLNTIYMYFFFNWEMMCVCVCVSVLVQSSIMRARVSWFQRIMLRVCFHDCRGRFAPLFWWLVPYLMFELQRIK